MTAGLSWPAKKELRRKRKVKDMDFTGNRQKPPQAPIGINNAICVGVYDLGMQKPTGQYEGKKPSPKVLLIWEVESGARVNCEYTRQISEWKDNQGVVQSTKLKKHIESWFAEKVKDPSKFNARNLLGHHCVLMISHSNSGYARVDAITAQNDPSKKNWQPVSEFAYYEIGDEIPPGTENWIINRINSRVQEGEEPQGDAPPPENQAAATAVDAGAKKTPF